MGLKYIVPFKDFENRGYEVQIGIEGYNGEVTELRGARGCFSVEGASEDFVYTPIRTSSATLTVLEKDLLLDLFSINAQYAPVKLYQGEKLMWTGYIKPEQLTQPYKPTVDSVSIECISVIDTLENIKYQKISENGFVSIMDVLRHIVEKAKAGYEHVYIPWVYAESASAYESKVQVLESLTVNEENWTEEEKNLREVLEDIMKMLAWTCVDYCGNLYFVDSDWNGIYHRYNEEITEYTEVQPNTVLLQDIGFAGSDHTIDVLPGYNKASVKSLNNVFDELLPMEDVDLNEENGARYKFYEGIRDNRVNIMAKRMLLPKFWDVKAYDRYGNEVPQEEAINETYGSVLVKIAQYTGEVNENGSVTPNISDYSWTLGIQNRINPEGGLNIPETLVTMKGVNASWKDGAIAIDGSILIPFDDEELAFEKTKRGESTIESEYSLRIGSRYWNGSEWTTTESVFRITYESTGTDVEFTTKDMKNPDMPYEGLKGYIIELPTDSPLLGELEFKINRNGNINVELDGRLGTYYGYINKNIQLKYAKKKGAQEEGENGDRVYENVVNESFMNEAEEIEFGIGSYNADGATYSKVLLNDEFLTDNLYSAIEGKNVRVEEALIRRIIRRYKVTQIKLTQVIKNTDSITPITVIHDNSMRGKRFMMLGGTWDFEGNKINLAMVENGSRN